MPSASINPIKTYSKNPSHREDTKSFPILPSEIPYHPPKMSVKSNYINSQSDKKISSESSNNSQSQKSKTILNLSMKSHTEIMATDESISKPITISEVLMVIF